MNSQVQKSKIYQNIITEYLEELAQAFSNYAQTKLDYQVLADCTRGHFQLTKVGWLERKFYFLVMLHLDVKENGKVWVQQNNTEIQLGEELEKRGIEPLDIVIGFRPEYMRRGTR